MHWQYPAKYADTTRTENTVIENDGHALTLRLAGIAFCGSDFESFKAPPDADPSILKQFTLNRGEPCSCTIECEMPIPVVTPGRVIQATLGIQVVLGKPDHRSGVDLALSLAVEDQRFHTDLHEDLFEDAMLSLQKQLPEGWYLKACITCEFSDYSPYGQSLFGTLHCFRNSKTEYSCVKTKKDIFELWDKNAGPVQETYVCSEFDRRKPNTGYRG